MALQPLHVWKLDPDSGEPMLDKRGDKIEHPKMNTRKSYAEMSAEEKQSFDDQNRLYHMRQQARAAHVLGEIADAKAVMLKGK